MSAYQKDLLPLPCPFPAAYERLHACPSSRSQRRRLHVSGAWQSWANDCVHTINSLDGHAYFGGPQASAVQSAALDRIVASFAEVEKPPPGMSAAGAFRELCCETLPYINDSGGPAPYKQGNVSLPAAGPKADLTAVLPVVHRELLMRPDVHMLHDKDRVDSLIADSGLKKPFVDPSFKSPKIYAAFLLELFASGIISFGSYQKPLLGLFFVYKKDGRLRLIFDTRICNCFSNHHQRPAYPQRRRWAVLSAVLKMTYTLPGGILITRSIDAKFRRKLVNISLCLASKLNMLTFVTSTDAL